MNPVNSNPGVGRTFAGMLVGFVLAVLSPFVMMTELLSLFVVIMLPSLALVALNRWAGRGPALFSAMLQLMFNARFLGGTFMWVSFFLTLLPVTLLIRYENRPFFTQMKISLAAFGAGVVLSVFAVYVGYGGNMVERMLLELPRILRTLPRENMDVLMQSYSAILGEAMSLEEFYRFVDQTINLLIPVYQINLPGLIFSGALVSAVLCVGLNATMRAKQGVAAEGSYLPVREWALPGSTTAGLLLMLAVSFVLSAVDMPRSDTVFYTVYNIALAAFCIQAVSSIARRLHASSLKKSVRIIIVALIVVLCLRGLLVVLSIYGVASATFGSRGLIRERMKNDQDNNHYEE